jgi:hypothetical protein
MSDDVEKMANISHETVKEASRIIMKNMLDAGGDHSDIMITLDGVVAAVLLATYMNPRMAASMLEESLVPGVINRISLAASRIKERGRGIGGGNAHD